MLRLFSPDAPARALRTPMEQRLYGDMLTFGGIPVSGKLPKGIRKEGEAPLE